MLIEFASQQDVLRSNVCKNQRQLGVVILIAKHSTGQLATHHFHSQRMNIKYLKHRGNATATGNHADLGFHVGCVLHLTTRPTHFDLIANIHRFDFLRHGSSRIDLHTSNSREGINRSDLNHKVKVPLLICDAHRGISALHVLPIRAREASQSKNLNIFRVRTPTSRAFQQANQAHQ